MNRIITLLSAVLFSASLFAQYPVVSITDINAPLDIANCNDTSAYYLDTVTFVAYVVTDGSLCEVASGSITGANGIRPFIWMNDTANGGAVDSLTGLEVMGVNWNTSQATTGFTSLIEGDMVEMTGVVGMYNGATQFQPLDNNAITLLSGPIPTITPAVVPVSDLNDANQINNIYDGHEWEGAFIEIQNVVVTNVDAWGSGTGARVEFTVADASGATIDISDFFIAQRLTSWPAINPNSPQDSGNFVAPNVGTNFQYIRGVVEHQSNGCAGGTGVGFRIHPFKDSHYLVGASAPNITNVANTPNIPTSQDSITVSADITDADGTITSAEIYYSTDPSIPSSTYQSVSMTMVANGEYEYTFTPQADGTTIYYYIKAEDNDNTVTYYPSTPSGQVDPNTASIYVRDNGLTIVDIQTPFSNGDSPFEGQEVTVRGYVTAGETDCDLGYVYIQDSAATEYAGLALRGSLALAGLIRNEKVEVTGIISESFGFTEMAVNQITSLGGGYEIMPTVLDPSDTAADMEMYESMLVTFQNPNGQLVISDENAGFGEYRVSTMAGNTSEANSRRVIAGRQNSTQAQSSLHVSLISDSAYMTTDGIISVPIVITQDGMTLDAITGPLWYSYGNFKVAPRNNFDIVNLSTPLDTAGCDFDVYSSLVEGLNVVAANVYPNPANDVLNISAAANNIEVAIYSLNGMLLKETATSNGLVSLGIADLTQGIYIVKVSSEGNLINTQKVVVNK